MAVKAETSPQFSSWIYLLGSVINVYASSVYLGSCAFFPELSGLKISSYKRIVIPFVHLRTEIPDFFPI